MTFTWIPLYEELATRLLQYENRQAELIDFLGELKKAELPVINLTDSKSSLKEIDPFSFFAVFNRRITTENRLKLLDRVRTYLGATAPLPTDFLGIPVADNQQSWFFPFISDGRAEGDIPALWAIARQATQEGRAGIQAATFDRCLAIKTVKIAKLSMALFWIRPRQFLPLDSQSQPYLRRHGVVVPATIGSWQQYSSVLDSTVAKLGDDFPSLSRAAFESSGCRYWAGGHKMGDESKLDEFLSTRTWFIGSKPDDPSKGAKAAWKRVAEVKPGDLFAIKGFGGQNILKVHAVGIVESVDSERGRLTWRPTGTSLFHGEAPGKAGEGTWFETLCEVTEDRARKAIFEGTANSPPAPTLTAERVAHPLNLILHGPPGTGKTWAMRRMRDDFALPEQKQVRWPEVADLTWFQVVALALHELGPSAVPALVEHPLVQAKYIERGVKAKPGAFVWQQLQMHTVKTSATVKYGQRVGQLIFDRNADGKWMLPNGLPDGFLEEAGIQIGTPTNTPYGNEFLVTFHPSFTYEDFVEGIRPETSEDVHGTTLSYPLRDGVFKQACKRAVQLAGFSDGLAAFCELPPEQREALLMNASPVVIFIDEINRGNVARIFGELITLIEPDKRLGATEELIVTLPGSRERFGVPSNLWIVGTMNTADRSVVALDVALRRRFAFRECQSRPDLLEGVVVEGVDIGKLLQTVNERLALLRDRDHLIGHAFFWPMKQDDAKRTLTELRRVFRDAIIPLLVEYFHDDLGRVGLVLGEAFVQRKAGAVRFARFEHDDAEDLADRPVWILADVNHLDAEAFRRIYA